MDRLSFASSVIQTLAWPLVVLVVVFALKKEIKNMLPFLTKLKAGPIEAEFEKGVYELKESLPSNNESETTKNEMAASKDLLFELAKLHPRSAIVEAWVRIEAAANLALAKKIEATLGTNALNTMFNGKRAIEALKSNGIISESQGSLLDELRVLRNSVVHLEKFEPSPEAVKNYIEMASHLQWLLEQSAVSSHA